MTEDDIAKLRSPIPEDFTIPADLTVEEMFKLQMVSTQLLMDQIRQSSVALARIHAYLDRAEAALDQLEKRT